MARWEQGDRAGLTAALGCAYAVSGGGACVVLAVALRDATNTVLAVASGDGSRLDGHTRVAVFWSCPSQDTSDISVVNRPSGGEDYIFRFKW